MPADQLAGDVPALVLIVSGAALAAAVGLITFWLSRRGPRS